MKNKALCIIAALVAGAGLAQADLYNPIGVDNGNGFFDRDIIFENTLSVGQAGATSNFGSRQFYEEGITDGGSGTLSGGLPSSRAVSLATGGDTFSFQLQEYTTGNNRVLHGGAPNGSINLATPGSFSSISFLVSSGVGANSSFSATFNYSDASSTTETVSTIPNWGTGDARDVFNVGRTDTNTLTWPGTNDGVFIWSHIHEEAPVDGTKTLESIDLALVSGQVSVMGISGVAAVPEAGTTALFGLGVLLLGLVRRR